MSAEQVRSSLGETVDTLRKAARLMQARAERATQGRWRVAAEGSEGSRIAPDCDEKRERSRFIGIFNGRVQPEDGYNAAHVASWHPEVALAVADWLVECARDYGQGYGAPDVHALAVARAYLGEPS